jgi:predicted transcriptional regulator
VLEMFGLGKPKTKLGKKLEKMGISNSWLQEKTKLNKNTITQLTSNSDYSPKQSTIKKIISVIRKEIDPNAKVDDWFDM